MSFWFRVTGLSLVWVGLSCSGGSSFNPARVTKEVGVEGGTLEHPAGASVVIPAGALDEAVTLTMEGIAAPAVASLGTPAATQAFQLGPEGQTFRKPIEVSMPVSALPAGADPARLRVVSAPQGSADAHLLPTRYDAATGRVVATTTHFSWFFLVVSSNPINFTTTTLPDATVGIPYQVVLGATGGTPPYVFSTPRPIPGLALAPDGTLSGTPTTGSWQGMNVRVTDAAGLSMYGAVYLRILWSADRPVITSVTPDNADQGASSAAITITGANFTPITPVLFDFTSIGKTYVSATTITATIPGSQLQVAGAHVIRVGDVDRGGYSNDVAFTVNTVAGSVVPVLTSIRPNVLPAGSPGTVVTASGSKFLAASKLLVDGVDYGTQYVSATQLRTTIPATKLAAQGTLQLTVDNPVAGGGTSAALPLTVGQPIPSLTSIAPSSAPMGSPDTTITLTGGGYTPQSQVYAGGQLLATTFVSATQLTAIIPASLLTTAATHQVQVRNPGPAGGQSASMPFQVTTVNPVPTLTSVSPSQIGAGASTFSIALAGTGFAAGAQAFFDATALTTNVTSATSATAVVPASLVASPGTAAITLVNPAPGGGTSGPVTFTILTPNPVPTLASLSPSQVPAGNADFTLTATGTGFVSGGWIQFGGVNLATTVVSPTSATATVPAAQVTAGGTKSVTFVNPAPGGGASGAVTFTVTTSAAPTITSLSPDNVRATTQDLPLYVWSNAPVFVRGTVVYANATALATMYVSRYQVYATVPRSLLPGSGSVQITARNPGSPPSNALQLSVGSTGNAVPTITSATPNAAALGDAATAVTVAGAGFATSNQQVYRAALFVRFAGDAVALPVSLYNNGQGTTVVNSGQLSTTLGAPIFATAGAHKLIVVNPPSGGGASNELTFTVSGTNPVPDLLSASHATVGVGTADLAVTLTGAAPGPRFVSRTRIVASGPMIATTDLGFCTGFANTCTITLPAALMAQPGTITLTATSPAPGGGTGTTVTIDVVAGEPTPTFASHYPARLTRFATPSQRLAVTGTGFSAATTVTETQSGASVPIASRTSTDLQLDVPASLLDGTYASLTFAITNPGPAGGTATTTPVDVTPGPWITAVSPTTFASSTAFTMTITGIALDLAPSGGRAVRLTGGPLGGENPPFAPATTSATTWTVDFPATAFGAAGPYEVYVEIGGYLLSNALPVTAQ